MAGASPLRFFFLDSIRGNDKSGWKPARNLGNAVVARRPKGQDDSATAAWPRAVLLPKFVSQKQEVDASTRDRSSRVAVSLSLSFILHTSSVRKLLAGIYSSPHFAFLSFFLFSCRSRPNWCNNLWILSRLIVFSFYSRCTFRSVVGGSVSSRRGNVPDKKRERRKRKESIGYSNEYPSIHWWIEVEDIFPCIDHLRDVSI